MGFCRFNTFLSIQRLLCDTARAELEFLAGFFGSSEAAPIFADVFGRVLGFFKESLSDFISNSWDSVGLLLLGRVVEHLKEAMGDGNNN